MDLSKILGLLTKYKYIIAVVVLGAILLSFPSGEKTSVSTEYEMKDFDVNEFEKRIEKSLALCEGVGRVDVILSLNSGTEFVYAKESRQSVREERETTESDSDVKPSIMSEGSGREAPLLIKEKYPEFRGAMIVCDGAESTSVQARVCEAVMSLTGLSSDRISVIKMKKAGG